MTDNKTKESASKIFSQEPVFEGRTKDIKTHFFYYGRGMQQKCLTSSKTFLTHVGSKFGESVKQSIYCNKLTVTEMTKPKQYVSKAALEAEDWAVQNEWALDNTDYRKYVRSINQDLSKSYSILWGQCNLPRQTIIKRDKEFISMDTGDAKMLFQIIQRVCNGSTYHQNCYMAAMESLYNFHLIKGEEYADTSTYLEAFDKRYDIANKAGWSFATSELRDLYIKELEEKRMKDHPSYKKLMDWRNTVLSSSPDQDKIDIGMDCCSDKYKAYVFIKRAGFKYENFRIDLKNAFDSGTDKFPDDTVEASRRLDNWRPQFVSRTREESKDKGLQFHQQGDEKAAEQHYEASSNDSGGGSGNTNLSCFKCGRVGHLTKECKYDKKENGDDLNSKTERDKLYQERADIKQAKWKAYQEKKNAAGAAEDTAAAASGAQHYMGSEVVETDELPDFEQAIIEEDEHDGQQYMHDTMVIDLRGQNHVFNQTGSHKSMKIFDMLCDNQSTCDVIVNKAFVINIRRSKMTLLLRTQAGNCRINMIADLPGVGTVWYYPEGVANILSQHRMVVNSKWDIDYNSKLYKKTGNTRDLKYNCVTAEGIELSFSPNKDGLHILDCSNYFGVGKQGYVFGKTIIDNETNNGTAMCHNITGVPETDVSDAIDTIKKSKQNFSTRDQQRANRVRRFQHVAAHPSDDTIIYSAMTNGIKNSPITRRDVKMALNMLGRSKYAVEGKTVRRQPNAVVTESMTVPTTILDYYVDVSLSVDIMHVNKVPFLISISQHIHYGTIRALDSMKIPILEEEIKRIIRMYSVRGFNIKYILVDIQFKAIKDRGNLNAIVNVVGKGEHAPAIERFIRVIKERCRCYYAMLPFDNLPRIMVIHLLVTVMFYINAFIWRKGVSPFLSPLTILEGVVLDYNLHFQVIFGEYAHTYEVTTNTMKRRTVGAIALGPTGNLQGGIRFYSLVTGKILQRDKHSYTPLKMPEDVIRRIKSLTKTGIKGLQFGDRNNIIDNDLEDGTDITGVSNDNDDNINEEHPYDIQIEDDDDTPPLQDPTPLTQHLDQVEDESSDDEDSQGTKVAPENAEDEVDSPSSDDEDEEEEDVIRTRSGRISRPMDRESEYPGVYYSNGEAVSYTHLTLPTNDLV